MQLLFAYFCNTQENQKKFIIICLHHNADSYLKLKAYVKMCTHVQVVQKHRKENFDVLGCVHFFDA